MNWYLEVLAGGQSQASCFPRFPDMKDENELIPDAFWSITNIVFRLQDPSNYSNPMRSCHLHFQVCVCALTSAIFLPQPPLPEEDYPTEDYPAPDQPEIYDELSATSPPPTLPKEYTLSHVGRTVIPRATLDRSTPAGWNLTVDPNGTWVFTSEHSPEQVDANTDRRTGEFKSINTFSTAKMVVV